MVHLNRISSRLSRCANNFVKELVSVKKKIIISQSCPDSVTISGVANLSERKSRNFPCAAAKSDMKHVGTHA